MGFMKKTAIVSCYFIYNYGSVLQAYATQKILDQFGIENETINVSGFLQSFRKAQYLYIIKSGITSELFRDRLGKAKNIFVKNFLHNQYTKNIEKRDIKFNQFIEENINLSDIYLSLDELSKQCNTKYKAVLIGSDQLWLPANIAANYYTLNFVPEELNSVAYATSFGVASLPNNITESAKKFLSRIKHLSVREQAGQILIENITGRKVPIVCDPTLLFTGKEWLNVQNEEPVTNGFYIFCYFIGDSLAHREFACRMKKETGCKIVALTHIDYYIKNDEGYADETPYNIGPAEFINLIRNATYVCTDSFHCSVFSILYRKNFFVFHRYTQDTRYSTNNRLETLLNIVNIPERILEGHESIQSCLDMKIDYDSVNVKLDNIRQISFNYLKKALADTKDTDL